MCCSQHQTSCPRWWMQNSAVIDISGDDQCDFLCLFVFLKKQKKSHFHRSVLEAVSGQRLHRHAAATGGGSARSPWLIRVRNDSKQTGLALNISKSSPLQQKQGHLVVWGSVEEKKLSSAPLHPPSSSSSFFPSWSGPKSAAGLNLVLNPLSLFFPPCLWTAPVHLDAHHHGEWLHQDACCEIKTKPAQLFFYRRWRGSNRCFIRFVPW